MASIQEEQHPEYQEVGEGTLRGAALGSRDAEIHDGQVRKTEESFGRIGAGQIKTSCDVEEEPSSLPSQQSSTQGSPVQESTKDPVEDSSSEVTRDIGNLKLSYTTEDDPQRHRSTLQKIKDKISDKEHKLKLGKESLRLNSSSGGGDHVHESKPGLLTRLKHKVWKTETGSGRHTDPELGAEDVAAADSEASSGSDTSNSSSEFSSSSERRPSATGTSGHRSAGEAIIKQPSSPSHGREQMATTADTPPSLDEGALPSSELGTGYEEDTEAPRRTDAGPPENAAAPAHGHPKWAPYKEDVTSGPPGDGGAPAAPLSAPAAQDRVPAQEDVPPLEEVKAPGVVDRLKEEVAAVGETVQEKIGLKADRKGTLVPDSSGNDGRQEEETTGILGRFAQRIGLAGSAASHGRSQST